jgi:hypothetical protein
MSKAIAILAVFFGVGLFCGYGVAAAEDKPMGFPTVAEKVQKGEIDVGGKADKAFGMALDRRYHRVHSEVLGLECGNCHVGKVARGVEIFSVRPAVDVSATSPGAIDRRACLGCHLAGPGRSFYGPRKP